MSNMSDIQELFKETIAHFMENISSKDVSRAIVARRYGMIDTVYYSRAMRQGIGVPYRCLLPKDVDGLLVWLQVRLPALPQHWLV